MRLAVCVMLCGCATSDVDGTAIRSTLADGQVLSGEMRTETLLLEGGLGLLEIPLTDVGEIVPVEGDRLSASNGNVTVWLRNGSELVGRWADPELTVAIEVGGRHVDVELPMDELERFQTRAGELWPDGVVYRVRTTYGDDLLVDADATQVVVENELGSFAPYLSECASLAPIGDPTGDWRIELENGTVLIGPLASAEIEFVLPHGPERVTVPLERFVAMERQYWAPPAGGLYSSTPAPAPAQWNEAPAMQGVEPAEQAAPRDWFDSSGLRGVKTQQKLH